MTRSMYLMLLLAAIPAAAMDNPPDLVRRTPQESGFDPTLLVRIDELVASAIDQRQLPGCVIFIGRPDGIAWSKAYGNKRIEPQIEPMTEETLFDLASLTKPVATATSIMRLVEMQSLSLDDRVSQYIPEFAVEEKDPITLRDLLVHRSGLIADNPLADYLEGPVIARQKLFSLKPVAPLRSCFRYSDVNFLILGEIVARVSQTPLEVFAHQQIFEPLGMTETGYLPARELRMRAAPTERRNGEWLQGEVHDPRAARLNGVAGHAGLFGTARDLAIYATDALRGLQHDSSRILKQSTWQMMVAPHLVESIDQDGQRLTDTRGLGWDIQSRYSRNRGTRLSSQSFGHGGFTGTSLWIDPQQQLYIIFLSNRLHPDGKGLVNPLIGEISNIVVESLIK